MRVPYGHLRTSQEWHDWDSLHKRFDPSTRTWDLFPEPIPHTVLHYSHLLLANSPNHPPPSLPVASGDVLPHESTWDHYGSSSPVVFIEDYDLPATSSIVPSPPMDINKDQVSLRDEDEDLYPTTESDSILSPSVKVDDTRNSHPLCKHRHAPTILAIPTPQKRKQPFFTLVLDSIKFLLRSLQAEPQCTHF